jgi:enoyl-CoA hydratase/carnithine racemase
VNSAVVSRGSKRTTAAARSDPVVLYEEGEAVAFVTINRPQKKNTLTEAVMAGIADGIDRANAAREVRAVVLRGTGGVFCAGYDLTGGYDWRDESGWQATFDAAHPEPRPGAWDPVRDPAFMGHNVRRFMKIWESPKPVIAQIEGWCVGGATELALCCDQLFMADTAIIGYPPSPIFGTSTTMLWVHGLGLERAKQYLLTGCEIDSATALRIGLVSEVDPAADPPPGWRSTPAGSATFPPTNWPSTSCSSTRPARTWACAPASFSARSSTASPATPRTPTAGWSPSTSGDSAG